MPRPIAISPRQHLLEHLKRRLGDDPPPPRVVFWDGETFDFARPPTVILTIRSPAGGELPHISRVIYEAARCRLEAIDMGDLRPHYALTLLHWMNRFEARAEEVIEAAGADR